MNPLALLVGNETRPSPELWALLDSPTVAVTPDPARRVVSRREWIAAHRDHRDPLEGHGFDAHASDRDQAYYGFDSGIVRVLVLDTVNGEGGWQGSLDAQQFEWLEAELRNGCSRFTDSTGRGRSQDVEDRVFILASHHSIATLTNDYSPGGSRRILGPELLKMLARYPNVACWVNGHTHVNAVRPVRNVGDGQVASFWELTVASHIDWPQQSRIIELAVDEHSGDLVVASTMLDHLGLVDPRMYDLDEVVTLAGWSRELAANAWQGRRDGIPIGLGDVLDRNVVCSLTAPFVLGRV
jgi:hypothetical protein